MRQGGMNNSHDDLLPTWHFHAIESVKSTEQCRRARADQQKLG